MTGAADPVDETRVTGSEEWPEEKLRQILSYIGEVRDFLRMHNWDVILMRTVGTVEDTWAHTWQEDNHTTLCLELCKEFFDGSNTQIGDCVTHELIHAQHRDVSVLWRGCIQENTSISVDESVAWSGDFDMFMERFVSWITSRVSDYVPSYHPEKDYGAHTGCYLHGEHRS